MIRKILTMLFLTISFLGGCARGIGGSETPRQALQAIINLYENQDFDTLIRERYAEIGKAKDEQQVKALVDRFKKRYADEKKRTQAIEIYKSLLSRTPEISGDGKVAIYKMGQGFVKFSRMPNGKWGFHM